MRIWSFCPALNRWWSYQY